MSNADILRPPVAAGTIESVDEPVISRLDVDAVIGALGTLVWYTSSIVELLEGPDEEAEEDDT